MPSNEISSIADSDEVESPVIAYTVPILAQVALPHSKPITKNGGVPLSHWSRSVNKIKLVMNSYMDGDGIDHGLPWGTLPRLILIWIITEVTHNNTAHIELGDSLSAWLRQLDLPDNGGTRSRLQSQADSLFTARFTLEDRREGHFSLVNLPLAERTTFFWDPNRNLAKQPEQWRSAIDLSPGFFKLVKEAPVPIDLGILKRIQKSPLAIDVYVWLSYRIFQLNTGSAARANISWSSFEAQMGSEYGQLRDFRVHVAKVINGIAQAGWRVRVGMDEKRLFLWRQPTSVSSRPRALPSGDSLEELCT
jgi:hypothetical protein